MGEDRRGWPPQDPNGVYVRADVFREYRRNVDAELRDVKGDVSAITQQLAEDRKAREQERKENARSLRQVLIAAVASLVVTILGSLVTWAIIGAAR